MKRPTYWKRPTYGRIAQLDLRKDAPAGTLWVGRYERRVYVEDTTVRVRHINNMHSTRLLIRRPIP